MSERDEGLSERDAEMLDSLYRATPRPSDDDAELAQLQQLRSVFAELKAHQDEPPPAGMALLMAAARQAAEERRPVGVWAKLRAGWSAMVAHPAMSAVAAAVLVVGVGGYLVARGVRPAAEQAPAVSSATEPVASPATAAPQESLAEPPAAARPVVPAPGRALEGAPLLEPERETGRETGREIRERKQELKDGARPRAAKEPEPRTPAFGAKKRMEVPRDEAEQEQQAPKLQEQWSAGPAAPPAPEAEEIVAGNAKAAPAKAATKAPKPEPTTEADATSVELDRAKGRGAAPSAGLAQEDGDDVRRADAPTRAQRWYELAKAAATKGDCEAVKLLGARIKSEDPAFYEARFRKDAAISKCLLRGSE